MDERLWRWIFIRQAFLKSSQAVQLETWDVSIVKAFWTTFMMEGRVGFSLIKCTFKNHGLVWGVLKKTIAIAVDDIGFFISEFLISEHNQKPQEKG